MNYTKIIGWLIFLTGIIIIGWTLLSSYNIFTGETTAPELFEVPKEEVSTQTGETQDIQDQLQTMVGEQLKGILPMDSMTQLFNLAVWSMLAFILIFGGAQISGLGIKLIKK